MRGCPPLDVVVPAPMRELREGAVERRLLPPRNEVRHVELLAGFGLRGEIVRGTAAPVDLPARLGCGGAAAVGLCELGCSLTAAVRRLGGLSRGPAASITIRIHAI